MKRQWNAEEMKEAARDAYCSAHGDCEVKNQISHNKQ